MYRRLILPITTNNSNQNLFRNNNISQVRIFQHYKHTIDKSRIPLLNEKDLEEQFIKGFGPGGSKTNKSSNCCFLKHIPTGLIVKCREARSLIENRKIARERMIEKLDHHINGELSVQGQKDKILEKKAEKIDFKQQKLNRMKLNYKELISNSNNKVSQEDGQDQEIKEIKEKASQDPKKILI